MLDTVNTDEHHSLPVALRLLIPLPPSLLEDYGLLALSFLLNGGVDSSVLDLGSADSSEVGRANHEDVVDADLLTDLEGKLLDTDDIVDQHLSLHTIDPDDCEDILRVWRKSHTMLWAMHIDDCILISHRL